MLFGGLVGAEEDAPSFLHVHNSAPLQGEVLLIQVEQTQRAPEGYLFEESLTFYPWGAGWLALMGVSWSIEPGDYDLTLILQEGEKHVETIQVQDGQFPQSFLTVSQEMERKIRPDEEDQEEQERRARDGMRLQEAFSHSFSVSLWTEPFILPTQGRRTTGFGAIRYVNGVFHNQHAGIDIANATGTPIHAVNDGVVRLVDDFLVHGTIIVIDHGLGVFSLYCHLHEWKAEEGDRVERGQVIATMGSTGFSTGPHLHWEIRIGDIPINPDALLRMDFF